MTAPISRDQILRRFEDFLDRATASEEPPRGIDAEIMSALEDHTTGDSSALDRRCDSYALWGAMTALAQEVKLEGRAFKELNDTLTSQANRIGEELRAVYRDRERELQREAERRCRREVLGALIDLRDSLDRGIQSARTSWTGDPVPQGWYARLGSSLGLLKQNGDASGTVAALIKGYELGLDRLNQTLEDFNVKEILCAGQPFDPRRMNAIDKEESAAVPEGTVVEVYRSGYEWNGEVFRPAQVKVACAPVANSNE